MDEESTSGFVASRKQIKRMAKIVALLKQGDWTTAQMLKELDEASYFGTSDISCSARTLRHDIEILKREYHCPVIHDFSIRRYTLLNKSWDFTMPAVMNRNELLAIVIGGKFSKDILPPSISRSVTDAVNEILRSNNTDGFLSSGRLNSLKILTSLGDAVSEDIFGVVFEAWRTCRRLIIEYSSKNRHSRYIIEPHAIVFYEMQWSIKAYCPDLKEWRIFLVRRIMEAFQQDERFTPDEKVIGGISSDNYYGFKSSGMAQIRLTPRGVQYAKVHLLRSNQTISAETLDTFMLTVPEVSSEEVLHWVLNQIPGDAIPVAPPQMVRDFRQALQTMLSLCPAD